MTKVTIFECNFLTRHMNRLQLSIMRQSPLLREMRFKSSSVQCHRAVRGRDEAGTFEPRTLTPSIYLIKAGSVKETPRLTEQGLQTASNSRVHIQEKSK